MSAPTGLEAEDRVEHPAGAGYRTGATLAGTILDRAAAVPPTRAALLAPGEMVTYGELRGRARAVAAALAAAGVNRGDRVVIQGANEPAFVLVLLGCWMLGAVAVTALPAHRDHELRHIVERADAGFLVVPSPRGRNDHLTAARRLRSQRAGLMVFVTDAAGPLGQDEVNLVTSSPAPPGGDPPEAAAPGDLAVLLLSGGSTGLPKLIPRTHDDYVYNARLSAEICALDEDTVYLAALPVAHNFALACPGVIGTLLAGGTVVLCPRPDPRAVVRAVAAHRATVTAAVPGLAVRLVDEADRSGVSLDSLRLLQVGGARLLPDHARRIQARLAGSLQQVFGMAEGLLCFTRPGDGDDVAADTQGRPASPGDEIRIVGPTGDDVVAGQPGELLTRGPYTITEYYGGADPAAFTADGWYRTGDIVRLHASGNLIVEGRLKDVINRGGEKISAVELEQLLIGHPGVRDVAVVAAPGSDGDESVAVVVVAEDPANAPDVHDLRSFLENLRVARFKLPDRVLVVGVLPVTAVGKPDKAALRQRVADAGART
jgi:2,3-dihydroxybenzoate-AMP ligase